MTKLEDQIKPMRAALETIEAFAAKFQPLMPNGFPGIIGAWDGPQFTMVHYGDRSNRDKLLSSAAEVFGTNGWTRHINYKKNGYDWKRVIDGVKVTIGDAESINDPAEGSPVFPNQFPVLLKDFSNEQPATGDGNPE